MEDNFKAWKAIMLEYGIDIKPEDYYPLEGTRLYELAKKLFEIYHLEAPDEKEVVRKKDKYYLIQTQ
jgi:beta-phosphoglucomutase-like phosphatase (HAD superfamily)